MDRLALDARTLLVAARAVGLTVGATSACLSVRGPKGAVGLAALLLERKADVLAAMREDTAIVAVEATVHSPPQRSLRAAPSVVDLASDPYVWEERAGVM